MFLTSKKCHTSPRSRWNPSSTALYPHMFCTDEFAGCRQGVLAVYFMKPQSDQWSLCARCTTVCFVSAPESAWCFLNCSVIKFTCISMRIELCCADVVRYDENRSKLGYWFTLAPVGCVVIHSVFLSRASLRVSLLPGTQQRKSKIERRIDTGTSLHVRV